MNVAEILIKEFYLEGKKKVNQEVLSSIHIQIHVDTQTHTCIHTHIYL